MNDATTRVTQGLAIYDAVCFILFGSEGFTCKSGQDLGLAIDGGSVHEQSRPFTPIPSVKGNSDCC